MVMTHVQFSSNSNAELNDLLSNTSEFNLTKYSAKWTQLSPLILHFQSFLPVFAAGTGIDVLFSTYLRFIGKSTYLRFIGKSTTISDISVELQVMTLKERDTD
ncbi:hypothetical protein Bca4012_044433 [Brassica carinata]